MNSTSHRWPAAIVTVILIVAGAIAGAGWLSADDEKKSEASVAKWQHLALTHEGKDLKGGELGRQINEVGRKGWELVDVETHTEGGTTVRTVFFFKKPL